jgi:hypothetical protein
LEETAMRLLVLAAILLTLFVRPAAALSEIQGLVQYDCQTATCSFLCTGTNTNLNVSYRQALVFQWKDHVRRLWIAVNDVQYVLGDDVTCKFEGKPSFTFPSSPLPPVQPPCVCIGNQCNPPGCRP